MIPEFCRTYYERTGHKVVAVMCGLGGQKIEAFLPSMDADYVPDKDNGAYICESTYLKYTAAINYLESNGYTVGNKLWVSCQGESDVPETEYIEYKRLFKKLHEYFKSYLGITKGALVQTGFPITLLYDEVTLMNKAQKELIAENDDIIAGSSYMYEYYIPDQTTYESIEYINNRYLDEDGNKLSYADAVRYALSSVCALETDMNNMIHHTSAALSQVGRETAILFTDVEEISIINNPSKTNYIQNYEELNLEGGKLKIKLYNGIEKEIDMTDSMVEISGFDNSTIGTNKVQITVRGKTISLDVNIIPKSIVSMEIKKLPTKLEYIKNCESLNLSGGIIVLKYNDNTSEELDMTNESVQVSGFDNTQIGKQTITITYEGKKATFEITILEDLVINFKEYVTEEVNDKIYIKKVVSNTTIEMFKNNIETNGTIEIYDKTEKIEDDNIKLATGMELRVKHYNAERIYKIVVQGDANGDTKADILDIFAINKYRLNLGKMVEEYLLASDYNEDEKVDIMDIFAINKFRLNIK